MKTPNSLITLIFLIITGCASGHGAYRLILVEKERHFLEIHTLEPCEASGFDLIPREPEEQRKTFEVELWITFKNCGMKEKIILDDAGRVMWGVPFYEKPKPKGSMQLQ